MRKYGPILRDLIERKLTICKYNNQNKNLQENRLCRLRRKGSCLLYTISYPQILSHPCSARGGSLLQDSRFFHKQSTLESQGARGNPALSAENIIKSLLM